MGLFILMMQQQIHKAITDYLKQKQYEKIDLKAVMFDMDGVLFDSMKNHAYCWTETMQHYGFKSFKREDAYMHEGRTGAGTINIYSNIDRGHDATEEEIEDIYHYKSELFNTCPKAEKMPGAHTLLIKVKESGVTPMVVTGSGQATLLQRLNHNFPDIFTPELMVTAFDVKYGKPNPEPYLMGMEKYNKVYKSEEAYKADSFLVVENAPLGVQAGVAAGVFTIAVNTGPLPDSALLDQGANILFPSMEALSDNWNILLNEIHQTTNQL